MICFFDTNVLVYAVDPNSGRKQKTALALYEQALREQSFAISTQVLAEFYSVTTRGAQPLLAREQAQIQTTALSRQRVVPTTAALIVGAMAHAGKDSVSWWDALLLEAALSIKANTLFSEDFQHGRRFGELSIVNPFLAG